MTTINFLQFVPAGRKNKAAFRILNAGIPVAAAFEGIGPKPIPSDSAGTSGHEQWATFPQERDMIRKARLGDAMAWETLVRQNVRWIFSTCRRWTGSRTRAEDLTQDVFIRVFQNLHSYRGELGGFRTWLRRLTVNLLTDDYRKNRKDRRTLSYDGADDQMKRLLQSIHTRGFSPVESIEKQERRATLREALERLRPDLRQAVILRDIKGLSYEEIGYLLQIPVGTVKSRVNRGRIELVRLVRQCTPMFGNLPVNVSALA